MSSAKYRIFSINFIELKDKAFFAVRLSDNQNVGIVDLR
mgnify:CR=1 FL=1|jgi:hypothetical protein